MSAYHALHESPYADDCPDCTGYGDPEPDYGYRIRSWSRNATVAAYLLIAALVVWVIVTKGMR